MAKIGYARVSTDEQNLDLQIDALKAAGVVKTNLYQEKASGVAPARTRQSLDHCLASLKEGDELIIWKLDRLGRSLAHLVEIVEDLRKKGVMFKSITEGIDTTTPAGMLFFHVMAALAQFERSLIQERVKAGMATAVKAGKHVGRPAKMTPEKDEAARTLLESGKSISEIAVILDVSYKTIYRALERAPIQKAS